MKPNSFQARILNNRRLPKLLRYVIVIFANWLFHGFLYMDPTEKAFFLLLDAIFFLPVFFAFSTVLGLKSGIILALITAHTMHWLFDGHLYVMLKNFGFFKIEFDRFAEYINELRARARSKESILAIAVFGSLSRGQLTEHSDLDVRIIRQAGLINGAKACTFTFLERSRALLSKIALDVYTCDGFQSLSKLSPEEKPVILHDPEKRLAEYVRTTSIGSKRCRHHARMCLE